ncbi:retrovirus-related pol polyprotein from transposon TNT 1-94 [Tanacetum coccineum]
MGSFGIRRISDWLLGLRRFRSQGGSAEDWRIQVFQLKRYFVDVQNKAEKVFQLQAEQADLASATRMRDWIVQNWKHITAIWQRFKMFLYADQGTGLLSHWNSKAKRSSFKTKVVPSLKGWFNLLHMDLCGSMRVASINGKKYILVIVDDYSRYTWTLFLRSNDETPEVLNHFLKMIQQNLQAQVISVRTNRGTKFLNKTLHAYFKEEGIEHQTSTS